ncbi:phosphatase PAP2 family protein [Ktedonobacter racemifer]|uniref:Phosphoesterase PA-phosphatase related protein n=1 Tax=Ktedonobacter racemifer DSM 44963 TaxID=485913 RepID=D6U6X8_KTERA|nr:phosphatase PAP2 family protein [Ktedonobacter racemifer]EFH80739.1 phosphoesterase PA-phosphatase related protein [Ktedonobacter racemifer DSM 44963]
MSATERTSGPFQVTQTRATESTRHEQARAHWKIELALWVVGVIIFLLTCMGMHMHPRPFSFDLSIMQTIQNWHLGSVLDAIVRLPSVLDDPFWSIVLLSSWLIFLLVGAIWAWFTHRRALTWLQNVLFLVAIVASGSGVNTLLDILVGRPRPLAKMYPIHNYETIVPFPSYPSGHVSHDAIYYGFLLYLSQTKPVRRWKYYRWLLPLQILAVIEIVLISYSRILMGGHWPTDVLGGYFEGVLWLSLFIFLYRWATPLQEKWQQRLDQKRGARHRHA